MKLKKKAIKRRAFSRAYLENAHKNCIFNKDEILKSRLCGCFDCKIMFPSSKVTQWIPDGPINTAWCPNCHNDTVIGDASNYPVNDIIFLIAMHNYWCNG